MINVSAEFKELMQSRTDFKQYAEITLADGTVWALDDTDFRITGNSVNDGVDANGLPLGVVAGRTVKLSIQNAEEQFKDVAFLGAEIRLYLTFQLSETVERVELGVFTVISPEDYGETISIQAVDNAWKLDTPYTTTLQYPQTAGAVFRDICTRCSILAESSNFLNNDFVIESAPDSGLTNREMIGYIAMIAGGNARFNRSGKLEILTYEFPNFRYAGKDYDGGSFEDWASGDELDGGNFFSWNSGDNADGGAFYPWDTSDGVDADEIIVSDATHLLRQWISLKPFTEDIVITGIQTTKTVADAEGNETETPVMYGADGYVLSIENPLIAGKEEAALALIGDVLVGARIRNFEGEHIAYPLAEFMDKAVLVDRKGNAAPTVLTDINFNFFGITTMANSAAPPLRLSSKYNSAAAQAIIAAKNLVAKEKSQRELAIENLNQTLKTSSGLYTTKELQADGSTISYLHDKPTLDESQTVIKVTADAIGVSNDGGDTYTYGFFTNGDAILRILQTEGINADWINAGALTVTNSKGKVLFQADVDTGNVVIDGNAVNITLNGQQTSIPGAFNLYVEKNDSDQIVSMLNASADDINITGDRIKIRSEYFNLDYDGAIDATAGIIGGFTITEDKLSASPAMFTQGITLDNRQGRITVGALELQSLTTQYARRGLSSTGIWMQDPDAFIVGNPEIDVHGWTRFDGDVTISGNLFLNGTIINSSSGYSLSRSGAHESSIAYCSGTESIVPSPTSAYVDSEEIHLPNAAEYVVFPSVRTVAEAPINAQAYQSSTDGIKIRVFQVGSWEHEEILVDWVAVKKS